MGAWEVIENIDPLTDAVIAAAFLDSESGRSTFGDEITLILRCEGNAIELFVDWSSYLNNEDVMVTSRINSDEPRTREWNISSDYTATFYPDKGWVNVEAFIGDAEMLVLQVEPYSESPITAVFDMTGFDLASDRVLTACGI